MTSSRFFRIAFWSMSISVCLMIATVISRPEETRHRILAERGLPQSQEGLIASHRFIFDHRPSATVDSRGAELLPYLAADNNGGNETNRDERNSDHRGKRNDGGSKFVPRQYASRPIDSRSRKLDVIPSSAHRHRDIAWNQPKSSNHPGPAASRNQTSAVIESVESVENRSGREQQGPTLEEQLLEKIVMLQQRLNELELAEREKQIELLERATRLLERWERLGQPAVPQPSTLDVDPKPAVNPTSTDETNRRESLFVPPTILNQKRHDNGRSMLSPPTKKSSGIVPVSFEVPQTNSPKSKRSWLHKARQSLNAETRSVLADIDRVAGGRGRQETK